MRETPGPIPNPEVKPHSVDGTARVTLWESRTMPDLNYKKGAEQSAPFFISLKVILGEAIIASMGESK